MQIARRYSKELLLALLLALGLLLVGCRGDPVGPKEVTLEGTWSGDVVGRYDLTLNLTEPTGTIYNLFGEGTLIAKDGSLNLLVTTWGNRVDRDVSLEISPPGFQPFMYLASLVDDNTLKGLLNGSGFRDNELVIARK